MAAASVPRADFPGTFALADTASTDSVKVRSSFGFIAPTPISLRAISLPRSFRIDTTTVYSQARDVRRLADAAFDATAA